MRRQEWDVGRDQTERLMRLAGVRGAKKSKRVFTNRSHKTAVLPSDLVSRRFTVPAPRRLWVCDITYVATWSGSAHVAFVTDVYSRRIVGWNVAATLRAEILPLQALDMAAWGPSGDLTGVTHHSDQGSNYVAMVYTHRIAELGAVPSTGTVGDSFTAEGLVRSDRDGLSSFPSVRNWKTSLELGFLEVRGAPQAIDLSTA